MIYIDRTHISLSLIIAISTLTFVTTWESNAHARPQIIMDQAQFQLNQQQFDSWVFSNERSAGAAQAKLESLLALQVENLDQTCDLTDAQKEKLRLAGMGDMKRFFNQVEQKRKEIQGRTFDQDKINDAYQELRPLAQRYASGVFGEKSLFDKISATLLDDDQRAQQEETLRQRRQERYQAKVELAGAMVGRSLGLTNAKQREFTCILLEETRPPRQFASGNMDFYTVMLHASQIPEERLRPLVDDRQWQVLSQLLQQSKGILQHLEQNGYIPDDDEETAETDEEA